MGSELNKKIAKIIKASEYIENGDPYKDVLDEVDIMEAIVELAKRFKQEYRVSNETSNPIPP